MSVKQRLKRGAGILLPVSSIPSPYGIGTFGYEAYNFVDFLKNAGCIYWQVLPVGPTSYGDSPYQSFSAFAGNPYFIDLEILIEEGLLTRDEVISCTWMDTEDIVDYARLYNNRFTVLKKAFIRSKHIEQPDYLAFCRENAFWLMDYSLYMAIKEHFNSVEWLLWEEDIRYRAEASVLYYSELLKEEIDYWKFLQYKFREQWDRLKSYANYKGISIIGDIPLYVALDSSDVWVHGDLFELDERKKPIHVAGVPPDVFSKEGQRWGNPLYRWDIMEQDGYTWWKQRIKQVASLYDIIRIDHFIGMVNYYSIPADCPTAVEGEWRKGPGGKLMGVIKESIGIAKIIAEDLGVLTKEVKALLEDTGYPGMKILEFGLDGPAENDYLPHNYSTANIVAYTGTHDNETLAGYLEKKSNKEIQYISKYFNVKSKAELIEGIIRGLYSSIADVAIVQMQDLLKLGNEARMNFPSTVGGNWKWRLLKSQYEDIDTSFLAELASLYGR